MSYAAFWGVKKSEAQDLEAPNKALEKAELVFSSSVCEVADAYRIPEEVFFQKTPHRLSLEGQALTLKEIEIGLYETEENDTLRTCKIGMQAYLERETSLDSDDDANEMETVFVLKAIDVGQTQILQARAMFLVSTSLKYVPFQDPPKTHSLRPHQTKPYVVSPPENEEAFEQSFIEIFPKFFQKAPVDSLKNILSH